MNDLELLNVMGRHIGPLDEAMVTVIRNRKRVKKLAPKEGYKVINGKYVKMSSKEKIKRSKASIKAAKKKKSQSKNIARKRAKSMALVK